MLLERILKFLLIVNFLGICGFWTLFLLNPSEPITLELLTHIISEYLTGIAALVSFILLLRRSKILRYILLFSLGMLFYASLQAIGWTITVRMYPLLILMVANVIIIISYIIARISSY